ncbi:MAG: FG-GAP-like repeat-containing protein [Pyrinomonadaceae bacterium]
MQRFYLPRPTPSPKFWARLIASTLFLLLFLFLTQPKGGRVATAHNGSERSNITQLLTVSGSLMISEFRVRGDSATDEFIEIYNPLNVAHTVAAVSDSGYAIAASDGLVRCTIPNGTVISAHGHYLCANSAGYSLSNYPGGNGGTAIPDATYTLEIPDNAGIALFNNNTGGASFNLANRIDAVGSTNEANTLYREGAGYPALQPININNSFHRRYDLMTGLSVDTDNNATDLWYVDPVGEAPGTGPRLGAPGPQNLLSPVYFKDGFALRLLDNTRAASVAPNRIRDLTSDPGNNSTLGTITIRRRFVNQSGANITRLRFRVLDTSTLPSAPGLADVRLRTVSAAAISGVGDISTCNAAGFPVVLCNITAQGTTLETPPAQPKGGGFNASLSVGTVTMGTPLANGASINLQLLLGVEAAGNYRLVLELESNPGGGTLFEVSGNTEVATNSDALNTIADFDGDGRSDLSVFRPSNGSWYLLRSRDGFAGMPFGLATDKIVPADFDGDTKTDIAVYRPSTGVWYIINSGNGTFSYYQFGLAEDLPVPADYDGDNKADIAVFRPSNGTWYRLNSSDGAFSYYQFGANGDRPAIGDYDGDGKFDFAVFRPSVATWYRINSWGGYFVAVQFGNSTDLITPGDYDGDGKTDLAVFRPSSATWYRINSGNGAQVTQQFGASGDIPTPGDYDLDGKEDISVFRTSDGSWYRLNSSNGAVYAQFFGTSGDRPAPSAFQF